MQIMPDAGPQGEAIHSNIEGIAPFFASRLGIIRVSFLFTTSTHERNDKYDYSF
jgi:hypothetical protein